MMKVKGLGLTGTPRRARAPMVADDMPVGYGGNEEFDDGGEGEDDGGESGSDPLPRKPAYPDRGGPDFDPTDPRQKPKNYDGYTDAARREAESVKDANGMMAWRRKWLQRAKEAGLTDQQASQALDDIEDSL